MDEAVFTRPRHLPGVELVAVRYGTRAFPVHSHDGFVVGTVTSGAEALTVRGETYTVTVGDVLHLHPDEPHTNASIGPDPLQYRVFYLPEASLNAYLEEGRPLSFARPVVTDPALSAQLVEIHERLSDDTGSRLEQESAFLELVMALARRAVPDEVNTMAPSASVRAVRAYIEAHYAEDFGLADLADLAGLSVFRIAHLFKASQGLSPIAYRTQCRVNAARHLLLTDQPIADIALELGFADQSHLTRHFQRIVGISPHRYRQQ